VNQWNYKYYAINPGTGPIADILPPIRIAKSEVDSNVINNRIREDDEAKS
jgi:hypothetical protein